MVLNNITRLEAVLTGAPSTNQPEVHVDYIDWNPQGEPTPPAQQRTAMNGGTTVTILAIPVQNPVREVIRASIYNNDTASVTVIIKTDDGTTERIIMRRTLLTLETLAFEKGVGFYIMSVT